MIRTMNPRQNVHIPFFRHDLFGLFAQYLPAKEFARLKQSCQLANDNGKKLEQKILTDPNLVLKYLSKMNKQMLSQFLQHYYHPASQHFTLMQTLTTQVPSNDAAIACYSLMATAEWVNNNQGNINRALNYLQDNKCITSDYLWQSLGFMLHPNIDLRTRILMHKSAYYNLRGQQLYPEHYNLTLIDLSWTNFAEANLHVVDFRNSNLKGACFRAANLTGAFLGGAKLHHADLNGADLQHANIDAWQHPLGDQIEARKTPAADFRGAKYNVDTRFPEQFSPKKHGMHDTTQQKIKEYKSCLIL